MSIVSKTLSRAVLLTLVTTQTLWAGPRIDRKTVWFGVEYTFQDQEMVNEQGRNTLTTPYKEQKAVSLAKGIAANLGLTEKAVERKTTWKQGWFVNVPGDGKWVVNPEPVTIEVNTTPRAVDEIVSTAKPIFEATAAQGLVPYVNPAAERSGMGHIHVGARKMGLNPFFANPLLLRNTMVYLHKNPALLHGFAEAFDIGMDSNIETYHDPARQKIFRDAVAEFDAWYDKSTPSQRADGFNKFIEILHRHDRVGFFQHYRFLNLEHVQRGGFTAESEGKITVEFRNFRPPKSPEVARDFAELLLAIMEKQSVPDVKEKFEWISWPEYLRFNTGTRVLENWKKVKAELGLVKKPLLDSQIKEYADAVHRHRFITPISGAEMYLAYSRKGDKGKFFELRLPIAKSPERPVLEIGEKVVDFEKIGSATTGHWVAILDTDALMISPLDLKSGMVEMSTRGYVCRDVFRIAN